MSTNSTSRERRDWTLIIFLLPIGIVLMLVAGQIAIRLVPSWSVDAGMQSSLDPESAAKSQPGQVQPISFDILTPMGWLESFLTPGPGSASDGVVFPPFIILEPSETPSTTSTAIVSETPVTPTATPVATTATSSMTPTKKPTDDDNTPTPALCNDLSADNYGDPLPCTYPPTPTMCTDPDATNNGGLLPCVYPTPSSSPLVGVTATVPSGYNEGAPNGQTNGANVGSIQDGSYIIITLSAPLTVNGISDTNYDLAYYERPVAGGGVDMDSVIISISIDDITYYVVFNWGDGTPDANSNVGDVAGSENDNQHIDASELHGTSPQDSGILIDVDNAPSHPPDGDYYFIAIQAPIAPPGDGNDGADVDSIQLVDETPTP